MTKETVRNILATLLVVLATLLLAGGGYYLGRYRAGLGKNSALSKLQASLDLINTQYVDEVSSDSLVETLIPSLMSHLDPHSSYLTADQRRKEREELEGYFYGIGVVFNSLKDTAIVIRTIPNGPSDLVGVRAGDRIVSVDGRSIEGEIPTDTIMSLLKGANESMVTLTLRDPSTNDLRTVKVKRGPVSTSKVGAKYMMSDSLGVIRLDGFSLSTYNDFMQAFAQLQQRGMKGLVLDLRDNPGGILESALRMVNEMLPKDKPVIYIEGAHYPREQYRSSGDGSLIGFPLYILINESSASAAEIVSGAMQDNDAAIVIGRRSFGKGLVQKVFEYLTAPQSISPLHATTHRQVAVSRGSTTLVIVMSTTVTGLSDLVAASSSAPTRSRRTPPRSIRPVWDGLSMAVAVSSRISSSRRIAPSLRATQWTSCERGSRRSMPSSTQIVTELTWPISATNSSAMTS